MNYNYVDNRTYHFVSQPNIYQNAPKQSSIDNRTKQNYHFVPPQSLCDNRTDQTVVAEYYKIPSINDFKELKKKCATFILFRKKINEALRKSGRVRTAAQISKLASELWKNTRPAEKKKYNQISARLTQQHVSLPAAPDLSTEEPENFEVEWPPEFDFETIYKNNKFKKKPPNGFLFFRNKYLERLKQLEIKRPMKIVSKMASKAWKNLPKYKRDSYEKIAIYYITTFLPLNNCTGIKKQRTHKCEPDKRASISKPKGGSKQKSQHHIVSVPGENYEQAATFQSSPISPETTEESCETEVNFQNSSINFDFGLTEENFEANQIFLSYPE
ncbi:4031_t:CDS:2 [Ambispora leptoticha]|uniref:4031_t:CDS:1 n=1 Tax=Ambispora leptoticha TaxID=144679 RepID=A0A9N9AY89_9GLOM|nr:4031_t:CDS:2 [Ambispora leptoticha]